MNGRGYGTASYASSFSDFGETLCLPNSELWILKRPIDAEQFDSAGLYPMSSCHKWAEIPKDFSYLADLGVVSLVLVTDPFARADVEDTAAEWSLYRPFKTHFVVDLRQDWRAQRAKNTRNYTNRAMRLQTTKVSTIGEIEDAGQFFDLYRNVMSRHGVRGIQALSPEAIRSQMNVSGSLLVVSRAGDMVSGAMLTYDCGKVAHLHLMGLSTEAYQLGTSYALIYAALEELETRGCRYVNLGGTSGTSDDTTSGLYNFKRRWANDRRTSLLCGKIFDESAYRTLAARSCKTNSEYFPAYRVPGGPFEWRPTSAN